MQTTIDRAGRIVVPKAIRDAMGLAAGRKIDMVFIEGRIEIELAPAEVTIDRSGRFPVAITREDLPPLTDDDIRTAIDAVRR